ncbi:MAG: segregation/condensation protein A [Eubacteriales bacterium]|nr:segregation/condensation protein A [Eubacteriales bacterium]MDD4323600.1 segregation/condensation protein A [Eubacteriales bacterium]MDD4541505.1 segregation/condensation protein A [Eubacteriales bacterium]
MRELKETEIQALDIQVDSFESPLELLDHLLERGNVALDKVSIASITDQYLNVIRNMQYYDMDLVSSFLLMAATLIQIKSSLLLPAQKRDPDSDAEFDPSSELIFQLLRYRRCRMIALQLKERRELYSYTYYKPEELPQRLGIKKKISRQRLNIDRFNEAVDAIVLRNTARFQSSKTTMQQILQRERVSVNSCMTDVMDKLADKPRFFFYELFPPDQSKETRIAGFLAILELLRRNQISAKQRSVFAPIYIEAKEN